LDENPDTYYNRSRVEGIGWKPWPNDYNKAITEDIRMNATKKEEAIFDKFWKFCEETKSKSKLSYTSFISE
jgi:hypothetical protein